MKKSFIRKSVQLKNEKSPKYGQKFFINDGNKYIKATEESGILSNVLNFGLGVAVADFNNDSLRLSQLSTINKCVVWKTKRQ
jgi:hypothetical protein